MELIGSKMEIHLFSLKNQEINSQLRNPEMLVFYPILSIRVQCPFILNLGLLDTVTMY